MKFTPEQRSAFLKASVLCSRAETCTFDIQTKLKAWGLEPEDAEPVIHQLKEEKYLDDERFARAYVKDKFRFNNWGRQKIAYMLHTRNICRDIQEAAFEEIDQEVYSEKLAKLIAEKEKTIRAKDPLDKRNKLMRFAMGRGFESNMIFTAFKELGI